MTKCPFCEAELGREVELSGSASGAFYEINCPGCTRYNLSEEAYEQVPRDLPAYKRGTISGYLRANPQTQIDRDVLARLIAMRPLQIGEQADRLLLALAAEFPQPGTFNTVSIARPDLQAKAWAHGEAHMAYLAYDYLKNTTLCLASNTESTANQQITVKITPEGWKHIYDLQHTSVASSQSFVAMWFDNSMDAARDHALLPAITDAGYDPFIVNRHPHNQDIMAEIIAGIRRSRFMVADFTGARPSVYYEAGFAFGLGQQIVHTCKKGEIPEVAFDVNHNRFLEWDPADLPGFRKTLAFHIESTIGVGPKKPTP